MIRRCELLKKGVMTGHKISHSNIKTKRRFVPNIQPITVRSDALGHNVHLQVAVTTLRSIDHNGGLDQFLLSTANGKLSPKGLKLKTRIRKALEAKASKKSA